jgi:hypothetical protein
VRRQQSGSVKPMALDLETLRLELQAHLDEIGMPVFYGYARMADAIGHVYWDTEGHPDFREFLQVGQKAGAKLFVLHHQALSQAELDEASEYLDDVELTREERRQYENRIRDLQAYEGFTCSLELSFAVDGHVYVYEQSTEWYQALSELLGELEAASTEAEDEGEGPIAGYFSKN